MLRFHSDEYIAYLQQVTPQNIQCNCELKRKSPNWNNI